MALTGVQRRYPSSVYLGVPMFYFILTIHLLLCFLIIGLVLLQQGKGAQVGALLSGSSNTLFGASGSTTTFAKLTTIFAICFFVTSILLIRMYGDPGAINLPGNVQGKRADPLSGSVLGGMVAQPPTAEAPVAQAPAAPAAVDGAAVDEAAKTK